MWLTAGDLVASQAGTASDPVDVLFELLRLDRGTFVFKEGEADASLRPEPIGPVLDKASERLEAWRIIATVVPSLSVSTGLNNELPIPSVMITSERWRAIVAVAAARTVADVATRLGLNEFESCKLVKELVDDGLAVVAVGDPPAAEPEPEPEPAIEDEAEDLFENDVEDDDEVEDEEQPEVEAQVSYETATEPVAEGVDEVEDGVEGDVADGGMADPDDDDDDDPGDRLSALSMAAARIGAMPQGGVAAEGEAGAEFDGEFVGDGDEPINRGLLLKFLSSVRS
jgi:hypothetical protein